MTKGTCTGCNKEYKNIEVHSRYCKAMKQETVSKSPTLIQTPAEPITSKKKISWKERIFNRGKRPIIIKNPILTSQIQE